MGDLARVIREIVKDMRGSSRKTNLQQVVFGISRNCQRPNNRQLRAEQKAMGEDGNGGRSSYASGEREKERGRQGEKGKTEPG